MGDGERLNRKGDNMIEEKEFATGNSDVDIVKAVKDCLKIKTILSINIKFGNDVALIRYSYVQPDKGDE